MSDPEWTPEHKAKLRAILAASRAKWAAEERQQPTPTWLCVLFGHRTTYGGTEYAYPMDYCRWCYRRAPEQRF